MNYFIYKNLKFLSIKILLFTSIFPFTFLNANETKYQKVSMEEKNIYLNETIQSNKEEYILGVGDIINIQRGSIYCSCGKRSYICSYR